MLFDRIGIFGADSFVCTTVRLVATRAVVHTSRIGPAFTKGAMRWLLFQRENNGLNRAVVKIGRRVLIDVNEFYRWIDDLQDRSLRDVEG